MSWSGHLLAVAMATIVAGTAGSALAQACTRAGVDVTCDDGRRGVFSGDAIIWADGTRSSLTSPHPSVIVGNKSSVIVGQGVFVGQGKGGCRWKIRATRGGRAARCSKAWRIAIDWVALHLRRGGALPILRQKRNSPDCPDGQITSTLLARNLSRPSREKYSAFAVGQITAFNSARLTR